MSGTAVFLVFTVKGPLRYSGADKENLSIVCGRSLSVMIGNDRGVVESNSLALMRMERFPLNMFLYFASTYCLLQSTVLMW
jgi:hypothetical protein